MSTVIAKKPAGDTFLAQRFNLKLVRTPVRVVRDANGNVVDKTEIDRIEFREGMYVAPDAETAEWLRRHPLFGNTQDGFREFELPPPAPSDEELDAILAAATDLEALQELLDDEQANYARPAIVKMLTGQLERLTQPEPAAA